MGGTELKWGAGHHWSPAGDGSALFTYFRSMFALVGHVAGDLNKKISFVVGILSTSFALALLGGSSIRARKYF